MNDLWTETPAERKAARLLRVMDRTGHTTYDLDIAEEAQAAADVFIAKVKEGWLGVKTAADGGSPVMTKTLDETAERTLIMPPLVGG